MGLESSMDSFLAFSSGGCATGGTVCYMSGQSCVDVGMSFVCCPPGCECLHDDVGRGGDGVGVVVV